MAAKDGDDGPGGLMSPAELKQALKFAKRKPVSCVIGFTKDKQGVILVDRRKKPRKLLGEVQAKAKAAGLVLDPASLRFGRVSVDGASDSAQANVTVNKRVPGAMRLALMPQMRAAGFQRLTINADESIESEADDGADEADEDGAESDEAGGGDRSGASGSAGDGAAPAPGGAARPDGAPPLAAAVAGNVGNGVAPPPGAAASGAAPSAVPMLEARLTSLVKRVSGVVRAGQPGAKALQAAAQAAYGALRSGDLAAAGQGADTLERLLGSGAAGGPPASTSLASPAGAVPETARAALPDAATAGAGAPGSGGTSQDDIGQNGMACPGALKDELTGLAKRIAPAVAADPSCKELLLKLANQANACLKSGDAAGAAVGIRALRKAMPLPAAVVGGPAKAGQAAAPQGAPVDGNALVQEAGGGVEGPVRPSPALASAPALASDNDLVIPVIDPHGGEEQRFLANGGVGVPTSNPADKAWDWTKRQAAAAGSAIGEFDASHGKVLTRGVGVARAMAGVGEGVGSLAVAGVGAAETATGIGAVPGMATMAAGAAGLWNARDNVQAGLQTALTGEFHPTPTSRLAGDAARAVGASDEMAERVTDTVDMAQGGIGAGRAAAGGVARREAAAATRATEEALAESAVADKIARINKAIDDAARSSNKGTAEAGRVAQALRSAGFKITSFERDVYNPAANKIVTDIDIEVEKFLIEVTVKGGEKSKQIAKLVGNKLANPDGKAVLLFSRAYTNKAAIAAVEKEGGKVFNDLENLLAYLKSQGMK